MKRQRTGLQHTESTLTHSVLVSVLLLASLLVSGCEGTYSFPRDEIKAGQTVAIAIDRQEGLSRSDITIRVTDSRGPAFAQDIPGTDPAVRAWINVYPDPLSKLVVGRETQQGLGTGAISWGIAAEFESGSSKDWFDSFLFLDTPVNLDPGGVSIDVLSTGVSILQQPIAFNVVAGAGTPDSFETYEYGPLLANQFGIMERANHYKVTFSGSEVPAAIQVDIAHDGDRENGGTGQAYVVQTRADLNAINWTDDGYNLRVISIPMWQKSTEDQAAMTTNDRQLNWFDFYIAGGITGVQAPVVTAYDQNGAQITTVSAQIN